MTGRRADTSSNSKPNTSNPSRRGRVACTFCHVRRTRCDAAPGTSCSNCSALGQSCILIDSKRGKYIRKNVRHSPTQRAWSSTITTDGQATSRASQPLTATFSIDDISGVSASSFCSFSTGEHNVTTASANSSRKAADRHSQILPAQEDRQIPAEANPEQQQLAAKDKEGSEMLYLRLCESYLSPRPSSTTPPGSHRVVYMGESYTFSYLVQEINSPPSTSNNISSSPTPITPLQQQKRKHPQPKLQWSVPASVDDKARNLGYDPQLDPGELEFLNSVGAFSVPERKISDRLVKTFSDYVFPIFPIFDSADFLLQYNTGRLSLLSLNAVYLLAVTLCSDDLIAQAGFSNRFMARRTFHKRVKALYHLDYETDKIAIITSLFIISFCWNGLMDEKDMWHWLGAAIGLAQAQGMHRSTNGTDLSLKEQRLWKRIWWSLYIRDRHSAAALGRPLRIRDEDCDAEMLQEEDFEGTESPNPAVFSTPRRVHILSSIHLAKLSIVFGQIILVKFTVQGPIMTESEKTDLTKKLETWRRELPLELTSQHCANQTADSQFWVNILDILYSHHLILLHRPNFTGTDSESFSAKNLAFSAASSVTRGIENLMISDTLRQAQLHVIPSIFAALAIQVLVIRNSKHDMQKKLAENHARQCMLSLSEMQKSWPVCSWVLKLFEQLLKHNRETETSSSIESLDSDSSGREKKVGRDCDSMLRNLNAEQADSGFDQTNVDEGPVECDLREVGECQDEEASSNMDWMQSFANNRSFTLDNAFSAGDFGFDLNDNTEFLSYLLNQAPPT